MHLRMFLFNSIHPEAKSIEKLFISLVCISFLMYKLITFNLQFDAFRSFPKLPIFDYLSFASPINDMLSFISILFLFLTGIGYQRRHFFVSIVILEILLGCADIMRLQPFWYFNLLLLGAIIVKPSKIIQYAFFIFFATYLFAGLHKFNLVFVNTVWVLDFLQRTMGMDVNTANHIFIKSIGFVFPIIEISLSIALLTKLRSYAVYLLILMHVTILVWLIHLNYNHSVWIWNIMMIFGLLFFLKIPRFSAPLFFKDYLAKLYGILLLILPIFSLFGLYYPYFSSKLYSGDKNIMVVVTETKQFSEYDSKFLHSIIKINKDAYVFNPHHYAMDDVKVPLPPSKWVFQKFANTFSRYDEKAHFYVVPYPFRTFYSLEVN